MKRRFSPLGAAIVVCVIMIVVAAAMVFSEQVGRALFPWRVVVFVGLILLATSLAFTGFVQTWRKVGSQITWGDSVLVLDRAPDALRPGAAGVVRDIRYIQRKRACLIEFEDGTMNVVPDWFLERATPADGSSAPSPEGDGSA